MPQSWNIIKCERVAPNHTAISRPAAAERAASARTRAAWAAAASSKSSGRVGLRTRHRSRSRGFWQLWQGWLRVIYQNPFNSAVTTSPGEEPIEKLHVWQVIANRIIGEIFRDLDTAQAAERIHQPLIAQSLESVPVVLQWQLRELQRVLETPLRSRRQCRPGGMAAHRQ